MKNMIWGPHAPLPPPGLSPPGFTGGLRFDALACIITTKSQQGTITCFYFTMKNLGYWIHVGALVGPFWKPFGVTFLFIFDIICQVCFKSLFK